MKSREKHPISINEPILLCVNPEQQNLLPLPTFCGSSNPLNSIHKYYFLLKLTFSGPPSPAFVLIVLKLRILAKIDNRKHSRAYI